VATRFESYHLGTSAGVWIVMAVNSKSGRIAIAVTFSLGVAAALVGVASSGRSLGSAAAGVVAFGRSPPSVDTLLYRCRGTIYTIQADGTEREAIGPGGCPAWSPDGKRLAVGSGRGIVVMDADGGNRREITRNPRAVGPGGDAYPSWSPDGRWIAFLRIHCCLDRPSTIFVVPAKGGRLTRVARTDGDVGGGGTGETEDDLAFGPVSWSPNGL
jgi:dipeptidyl aminopeptidase/acylaminoacyl peptidase